MDFTSEGLSIGGFQGFIRVKDLVAGNCREAPGCVKGVYVLVRENLTEPVFLEQSVGGLHKGRSLSEDVSKLRAKWVPSAYVMSIGCSENLNRRIRQLIDCAAGRNHGHRGERYVWQLADSHDLLVAWKPVSCVPKEEKRRLLCQFAAVHDGRVPFANVRMP